MRAIEGHRDEVAIAAVTWHEALYGLHRLPHGRRRAAIEEYLLSVVGRSMPILSYDSAAADWHARERARLESRGWTPPFADGQIAAIAYVNDLVLVTGNPDDYARFEGLRTENWLS